ncbi:MAG: peptide-N-glycosidase F-related protein [Myxococcota bacterium]
MRRPALLLLAACTGPADGPADTDTGEATDTGDTTAETDTCAERGLTKRAWDATAADGDFDTVAPDFSLALLDGGTFTWSERFTGCDAVVSVVYDPAFSIAYPDFSRVGDVRAWLESSPTNVHYLLWVDEIRAPDREAALVAIREKVDEAISRLDDAELAAWWPTRIHYVAENPNNPEGAPWIDTLHGEYRQSYPTNWGIDRFGVVRELGYLADSNTGWEEAPPSFLSYEVEWFNHQSDLQDRLDADGATVLRAFENTAERVVTLELPDAATMATFDTLELDMSFLCGGHPDPVVCGEWDYLAYAYLCENDDPATPDVDESNTCTEIARFITAYARPGRWVVDATPFLAELQAGGAHTFRVNSANAPYITLDLRLSNQGKGYRPVGIEFLWSGGAWDEHYNTLHEDRTFTPPAGTTRVDVWNLVSGHGFGADRENCAEFCNHQHAFTVNDRLVVTQEFPEAGTPYGCAEQVGSGTVPNQYGTWVLGRGGWCPGRHVDPWSADVTEAVDLAGGNTIAYRGLFEGADYVPTWVSTGTGFAGRVDVASWLVYYQ